MYLCSERKDALEMPEGVYSIVQTREIIVKEINSYCRPKLMALQGVLRVRWWGRIISPSVTLWCCPTPVNIQLN